MELQEQIMEINQWKWYLDQKPKWLAEKIEKRFDRKVTSQKLRAVGRKMKKNGLW